MSYELSIPLKRGTVEIEFEDVDDLERQLKALDVRRIERLLAAALKAPARKARGSTPKKRATPKKGAAKKASKRARSA